MGAAQAAKSGNMEAEDICTMETSELMVCDMEGLSPEQQAFMRRKLEHKKMMGGLNPQGSPSSGAAPPGPAPGQYSPEQLAFLERKKAHASGSGNVEPEEICTMETNDLMV